MLDALDGAIEMMSVLETPASLAAGHGKERRTRIDIVTLLFDVAPNAKIAIAPGAGTEVFGVEQELRRMLDLLFKQSGADSSAPAAISVHRESDWVVVSIGLGPEGMATRDLEHRWLNRMALRHGGRVELKGNETRLYLPADAESGQQEIQQLRKELEQAQQLGAVYAKELAEAFAFATGDSSLPAPATSSKPAETALLRLLVNGSTALCRTLRQITESLRADITRLARVLGDQHELVSSLLSRQVAYGELVLDLDRISRVNPDEPTKPVNLAELLRECLDSIDGRAKRLEVSVSSQATGDFTLTTQSSVVTLLLRALLDQALHATPKKDRLEVLLRRDDTPESKRYVLIVADGGPQIPESALPGLLQGTADPSGFGRPSALSWIALGSAAAAVGATVCVGESTQQRSEVRLTFG
jgi:signal transduction histidine kinase